MLLLIRPSPSTTSARPAGPAETPPGHVVGLGQGVDLDGHFEGPVDLEDTRGLVTVERNLGIGGVADDDDLVAPGEGDRFFIKVQPGHGAGRIVGVVEKEQFGPAGDVRRNGLEVRQKAVGLDQGHEMGPAAGKEGPDVVDGVGRFGDQGHVAGVDEGQGDVGDPFLGPDQGDNLTEGFELDAEAPFVPGGHAAPEVVHARVRGVLVIGRVQSGPPGVAR